ncbi:MAG: hypothetical protein ACE5LB_04335 [Acidiferrobacterales bacterium]
MNKRLARLGLAAFSLMGLCMILLAVIALELDPLQGGVPADVGAVATESKAKRPALPGATIEFPPMREYAEIVKRPLFDASRRPPRIEAKQKPDNRNALRQLTLTGVVMTPQRKFAILHDKRQRQMMRVEQGAPIAGWSLHEVRPDSVTFRKGAATHEMRLHKEKEEKAREEKGRAPRKGDGKGTKTALRKTNR